MAKAKDCNAINAEHQCFQGRADIGNISSSINDTCLKCWCMYDFEQRVYVLEVDLPELEYMSLIWMQGCKVNIGIARTEEEVFIAKEDFVPYTFHLHMTQEIGR